MHHDGWSSFHLHAAKSAATARYLQVPSSRLSCRSRVHRQLAGAQGLCLGVSMMQQCPGRHRCPPDTSLLDSKRVRALHVVQLQPLSLLEPHVVTDGPADVVLQPICIIESCHVGDAVTPQHLLKCPSGTANKPADLCCGSSCKASLPLICWTLQPWVSNAGHLPENPCQPCYETSAN